MDLNKSLDTMIELTTIHLLSCMKDYPNKSEIVTSLKNLKENGYIYKLTKSFKSGAMEDLSKPMEYLIQCNILYLLVKVIHSLYEYILPFTFCANNK